MPGDNRGYYADGEFIVGLRSQVRAMNLSPRDRKLKKGVQVGEAEPVEFLEQSVSRNGGAAEDVPCGSGACKFRIVQTFDFNFGKLKRNFNGAGTKIGAEISRRKFRCIFKIRV